MHERQRRQAARSARESLEWMARALRDPLTGVGNRSALDDDVLAAQGSELGLLLVDIDYFKQYNDSLGHPDGDRLLRRLVQLIEQCLGVDARLYRLGGDEFAGLIACHDDATLALACQRLIEGVHDAAIPHPRIQAPLASPSAWGRCASGPGMPSWKPAMPPPTKRFTASRRAGVTPGPWRKWTPAG
ncbi:GGDEF domain-containing protein [Halomonas sp. E19]|uniref:GGDEF domain-containing protein n=1 Tax=Halomonas sp. E19 TaxID=3397247 RepID=UPI0040348D56